MSSAEGSVLSRNHWKKVRAGPCRRLREASVSCLPSALPTRFMPSFHFTGVLWDAGLPAQRTLLSRTYCVGVLVPFESK